jgi:predicted protein tyrosine phosphatase
MGIELRIGSYVAATLLLEHEPKQWNAIVLLDSDMMVTEFLSANAQSHLCLRFDDIEEPRTNKQAATKDQIAQALEFARGKEKLLVSCRAGRGRSVALAYVICCQERGVTEALKLLDPTRQRPNRLVVGLGDAILESTDVLGPFDEWRRRYSNIRLSDYYDEMEKEYETLESQGVINRICAQ